MPSDAEVVSLFQRGAERFSGLVDRVRDDQWRGPTPDEGWDVRTLVHHLVYELVWAPPLFAGETIQDVGDRFDGDLLGSDPKATCRSAVSAANAALSEDAMERTVHLSYGDVPGRHYAFELTNDLWIHGWDLARAIGADDRIDDDAAQALYAFYGPLEDGLKASGLFGPKVEPPDDADVQMKLLAVMGRRSW